MSDDVIKIENLSKVFRLSHHPSVTLKSAIFNFWKRRYENLYALEGLFLKVRKGETVAVIGRNGSGKSTLLGLIARVYKPTVGTVEVNGKVAALLELGAGFHPDLSGEQNVLLNGVILGMRERDVRKSLNDIIEFAGLEKFRDAPLRSYSAGMTMRLGFAVAMFTRPDILLIDEVLAVGDEHYQQKCLSEIERFQSSGGTIVFVSHDLPAVKKVATRVVWIERGKVVQDGNPVEVIESYLDAANSKN